jgi:hypothetical protein
VVSSTAGENVLRSSLVFARWPFLTLPVPDCRRFSKPKILLHKSIKRKERINNLADVMWQSKKNPGILGLKLIITLSGKNGISSLFSVSNLYP